MQWLQKSIQNIIIIRDHLQKNVSLSNSLELKKKKKNLLLELVCLFWNSIPLSFKTLNISNFRQKIKSLLLNVLGNGDNYLNVNLICCIYLQL